jgi:hypothetical protein
MIRLLCFIRQRQTEPQASILVRIDAGRAILAFDCESKTLVGSEAVSGTDAERVDAIRSVRELRSHANPIAVRQPARTDPRKHVDRAGDPLLDRAADTRFEVVRLLEFE